MRHLLAGLAVLVFIIPTGHIVDADEVTVTRDGATTILEGKIVVEATDNSILFLGRDGQLSIFNPDEIQNRNRSDEEVAPLTKRELGKQLIAELPDGFKIYESGHFVIAYQTEKSYARWVGGLYNRLDRSFTKFWRQKKKFKIAEPEYPLAIIIFSSKSQYDHFVHRELGIEAGSMVAYYNLMTNRVAMYDLTSTQLPPGGNLDNDRRISEVLSQPSAIPMVATVIHEGTHQLMFNTGMQTRFSDTPLWLNEGMAMYFETPDLSTKSGWRKIGEVNPLRLHHFRTHLDQRAPESLANMLSSDDVFQDPATKLLAYSEAWAFNYFLLEKHSDAFVEYLKHMSTKEPQKFDGPEVRLKEFKQFLGDDLNALDREFIHYIRRLSQ